MKLRTVLIAIAVLIVAVVASPVANVMSMVF